MDPSTWASVSGLILWLDYTGPSSLPGHRPDTNDLFFSLRQTVPFPTVHADHLGPFIKTKSGNTYVITIIDAFTKFILVYPVKSTQSRYLLKVF